MEFFTLPCLASVIVLLSIHGQVEAQNQACMTITTCFGKDFNAVLKNENTEGVCRKYRDALDCVNPKIDACLPSIGDNTGLVTVFTSQRDGMQANYEKKCGGKYEAGGASSSSACTQADMAKCSEGASAQTDPAQMCEIIPKAEQCFKDLMARCDQDVIKNALKQALAGMQMQKQMCGSSSGSGSRSGGDAPKEGCDMKSFSTCAGTEKPETLKEKCKLYPVAKKCMDDFQANCPSMSSMVPSVMVQDLKQIKKDCKEKGYRLGGPSGAGALSPASAIFLVATALLAAVFRF